MIEIRTIYPSEAGEFLRLLCGVFGLDLQRANAVFFAEPFFNLDRKWALFEDGVIRSCLTTTPLIFGDGPAIGIAGVATDPECRNRGFASELLQECLAAPAHEGLPTMLFAKNPSLYLKHGFDCTDRVVKSALVAEAPKQEPSPLPSEEIQRRYNAWAAAESNRLRRDETRWRFWNWHFRVCYAFGNGYIASEPGVLREVIPDIPVTAIPLEGDVQWYGLESMVHSLGLPVRTSVFEMHAMTRSFRHVPQLFLTDQF